MMSPESVVYTKPLMSTNEDHNQSSGSGAGGRKSGSSSSAAPKPSPGQATAPSLRCPRCDSPNTKFCYYNNYSLTQPRHFCKTCRRYWTKGGALRNVPIGGGCRKNKKIKSSRSASGDELNYKDSSCNSYVLSDNTSGGLLMKSSLFHGLLSPPSSSPSMEFHHDQLGNRIPFSRLNSSTNTGSLYNHQLVSFGDLSSNTTSCNYDTNSAASSAAGSLLMAGTFNYNINHPAAAGSSVFRQVGENNNTGKYFNGGVHQEDICSSMNNNIAQSTHHSNLASSIESLSSINQELHWKLQQQRLAMIFGGGNNQKEMISSTNNVSSGGGVGFDIDENQMEEAQKPLPISFQNLEISKQEAVCGVSTNNNPRKGLGAHHDDSSSSNAPTSTGWILDENKYSTNYTTNTTTSTTANAGSRNFINDNLISTSWKGIQAWSTDHLHNSPYRTDLH